MWTVIFGPNLEFHLSNVDTKIKVLDFDSQITTTLKKYCQQKCDHSHMDTFQQSAVDNFNGKISVDRLSLWTVDTWTHGQWTLVILN